MRCLYCGKELALLKRWTGGGEFCSDAHRQRYQEEYNQLALNRLLQAKPPSDPQPAEVKPASPAKPVVLAELAEEIPVNKTPRLPAPPPPPPPPPPPEPTPIRISEARVPERTPVAVRVEAPVVAAPPEVPVVYEKPVPAEAAGFLVDLPIPLLVAAAPVSLPDVEFFQAVSAALPNHAFEPLNGRQGALQLETAGLLTYQPSNRASNYTANGSRERRLEVRDFVRTTPIVEIDLSPAGETGLETSSEAMDILIFPQPPRGLPALWHEPSVGFSAGGTELGDLARLLFPTTGFSDREELDLSSAVVFAPAEAPAQVDEPPVQEVHGEPEPERVEAVAEALPEVVPEPVVTQQVVEPEAEQAPSIPEPVTKPLPLLLQVAGPGKAKAVQVFSSASSSIVVQVPRSTSLPLRPVMVFGPAPVKEVEKVVAVKKASVPPPAVRLANGKSRQPDLKADVKPALKDPKPDNKKPDVREVKLKEDVKPSKQPEPLLPAPLAAPYPGSGDLGLPRLNLQSSGGFWGGLPFAAKIAIVVFLVAALGGFIAYSSKSGGAAVTSAHGGPGTLVVGPALPASDEGWITDWGADPGVRRTRQISVLRSSQTFTDYRIVMEGQIETKAIGWIFRAADPKNFYVAKIEIVKPGLEPTVALIHFAVINGEEQVHAQLPLPMKVRRDTLYKIRFDAVGSSFTTYVQDEKVDEWTDDNVKTGGVGLYSERGEVASLKGGMSVLPLIVRR